MLEEESRVKNPAKVVRDKTQVLEAISPVRPNQDHHISRATLNFWLDTGLMVLFVSLAIVATIVQFVFPPGTGAKGWALWGMDFNQWSSLQYGLLSDFGFAITVHVMLHWSWVCTIVGGKLMEQLEPLRSASKRFSERACS